MAKPLTKVQTMKLLDAYHEHEVLWNPKHPQYRYREHRVKAFKNIIEAIGSPDLTIKRVSDKIQRIRSLYCSAVKKLVYYNVQPTSYWFKKADSFLRSVNSLYKMPQNMKDEIRNYKKNKIKSGDWKTKRLLPLILEFKKHPCLWDTTHAEYGNRVAYYEALLNIKKNIGGPNITILDIEKKITYIRKIYTSERGKVLFEDIKPKRYWYDVADEFLQKFTDAQLLRNIKIEDIPKLHSSRAIKERLLQKLQASKPPKPNVTKTYTRSKKPIGRPSRPATVQKCTEKEFKIFGQLIAEQLRKMPLSDALKLQQEMQAMINKTRLSLAALEGQPSSSTSDAVPFVLQDIVKQEHIKEELENDDDEYYD